MHLARSLPLLLLLGCPGPPSEPVAPRGGSARPDAGAPHVADRPSDQECEALITHALDLGMAELRARDPDGPAPDAADLDKLKLELRADAGCKTLSRAGYRCAIAARSLAELEACAAAKG